MAAGARAPAPGSSSSSSSSSRSSSSESRFPDVNWALDSLSLAFAALGVLAAMVARVSLLPRLTTYRLWRSAPSHVRHLSRELHAHTDHRGGIPGTRLAEPVVSGWPPRSALVRSCSAGHLVYDGLPLERPAAHAAAAPGLAMVEAAAVAKLLMEPSRALGAIRNCVPSERRSFSSDNLEARVR